MHFCNTVLRYSGCVQIQISQIVPDLLTGWKTSWPGWVSWPRHPRGTSSSSPTSAPLCPKYGTSKPQIESQNPVNQLTGIVGRQGAISNDEFLSGEILLFKCSEQRLKQLPSSCNFQFLEKNRNFILKDTVIFFPIFGGFLKFISFDISYVAVGGGNS